MANYAIDPALLKKYVPAHTELDEFNGVHYASLVGFLFQDTRVRGIAFPFHRSFEEVNLRFYVRYKEGAAWKRGVVFMKEIVPRRLISFVANTVYGENYATHAMRHEWKMAGDELQVAYYWKAGRHWNYLKATAAAEPQAIVPGSAEAFITEHYWGYTFVNPACTGVYQVRHPRWRVHPVHHYAIECSAGELYGPGFAGPLRQQPVSVFVAEGSPVEVMPGGRLYS